MTTTNETRQRAINAAQGMHVVAEFKDLPVILLDPGHGGVIDGIYQTDKGFNIDKPGSYTKGYVHAPGVGIMEGEFNRAIVNRVKAMMFAAGYPCVDIVNSQEDVPLKRRTQRANDYYYNETEGCILISIHANAGKGTGHETFTSPGETSADPLAEEMIDALIEGLPIRLRADKSDGDHDKEARFWMVMQTVMPAMLVECGFMDRLEPDFELLMSEEGRDQIAKAIFDGIERIYRYLGFNV